VTVSQDDVEYAYNMYLLSLATTKLQEKALSEVTAENEVRIVFKHRVPLRITEKHSNLYPSIIQLYLSIYIYIDM
jgi:hypothetical protein